MSVCIVESQKLVSPDASLHAEQRYEVDHFDGAFTESERTQPVDNKEVDSKQSDDMDRSHSREKDAEKIRDKSSTPTSDRNLPSTVSFEDKFTRSSRGGTAGGLQDGERHRTRRKEMGSWADETVGGLDEDPKVYSPFELEVEGSQSSRKDEGRGATSYSRRKSLFLITYHTFCAVNFV